MYTYKFNIQCIISVQTTDNELKITVTNNGEKIPDEIQQKIFEPNFTTKQKGNGLGLAYCKSQLKLLDGDVKLLHSNTKETSFAVTVHLK